MTDLDELEAKARAAKEATKRWLEGVSSPDVDDATEVLLEACDPDTVLDLIERVRAGEEMARSTWEHRCSDGVGGCTAVSASSLERWESLAHSPQEA